MKKLFLSVLIIFALFFTLSGQRLKLLEIKEPPGGAGKHSLLVNVDHANAIIQHFNLKDISGAVELADMEGNAVAKLGKVKKGTVKWSGKLEEGHYINVKFEKEYFPAILEQVKKKALKPGLRLQTTDVTAKISSDKYKRRYFITTEVKKETYTLEWKEITFSELPDLTVSLKYPVKAQPGDEMKNDISVIVENNGTAPAEKFDVDLVLSKDNKIPVQPAVPSETFTSGMLLENGRLSFSLLKPGDSITLNLENPIRIPADTLPDKYYLGAIADPGNTLKELDESNNVYAGFLLITVAAPERFFVDLPGTQLSYDPNTYDLKISCNDIMLSDGKDWRKCRIKPYVHQIKHVGWEDFLWEINTDERGVYQVKTPDFCKSGGKTDKELRLKMYVKGGSTTTMPSLITLDLPQTYMQFETEKGQLTIMSHDTQIAYFTFWKIYKFRSHLYQVKHDIWTDFFWEVDTFNKVVNVVKGVEFTQEGGTRTPLDLNVRVE